MESITEAVELSCSANGMQAILNGAMEYHLQYIHRARQIMIRRLLPPAEHIIDLGGANAPLYNMGYPHRFSSLAMLDLPPEERAEEYSRIVLEAPEAGGQVSIVYGDMTQPDMIPDESMDLAWSGQSIEHVPVDAARKMCRSVFRVLRPGGWFCLDTPNRLVTTIHTQDWHDGYINSDHKYEYRPDEVRAMLLEAGFEIESEYGICEMPISCDSGQFDYTDFILGNPITKEIDRGYSLYFACRKPL